jgi:hypothetical protein
MTRARRSTISPLFVAVAIGAASACFNDPTHDQAVSDQGDDPTGHRNGPLHRAGQPCLVCHDGRGTAHAEFTVAGTVYRSHDVVTGVQNAEVTITDTNGASITALTNEVGNFYLTHDQFEPTYPVRISVAYTGPVTGARVITPMVTTIGRNGSCASCHFDPENTNTPGHVYVISDDTLFPQ